MSDTNNPDAFTPVDVRPIVTALNKTLFQQLLQCPGLQLREEQSVSDITALMEALESAVSAALPFCSTVDGSPLELIGSFQETCWLQGIDLERLELEELGSND